MKSKAVLAVAAVAAALLIGYGVGVNQPSTDTSAVRASVSVTSAPSSGSTARRSFSIPAPSYSTGPVVTVRPTATGRPTSPGHTARVSLGAYKTTPKPEQQTYILNKNTKKFHYPWCSSVKQMKEKNKIEFTGDRQTVIDKGYDPCQRCYP